MDGIIDIADLDCIYISYDEPQKDQSTSDHSIDGTLCEMEDVSIITETVGQHWKLVTINKA